MRNRILNSMVGLWLMISPSVLEMNALTSKSNYIVGPLVITFSIISLWDINRNAVRINIVPAMWLLIALFALHFTKTAAFFSNGACGVFIIVLSLVSTKKEQRFGGGWRSLFQHNPLHLREAERMEMEADHED